MSKRRPSTQLPEVFARHVHALLPPNTQGFGNPQAPKVLVDTFFLNAINRPEPNAMYNTAIHCITLNSMTSDTTSHACKCRHLLRGYFTLTIHSWFA